GPGTVAGVSGGGWEPTPQDKVHRGFRRKGESGKGAGVYPPPGGGKEGVWEISPPVADDWMRENDIPQPPREYDDAPGSPAAGGPVAITGPSPYQYVSGGVVITGNAMIDNFALYRLGYGQGLNPTSWNQLGGDHTNQVDNGPLEFWDTAELPEGLYTLQLTVVRHDQSFQQSAVQVTMDNTPATVILLNPPEGKVYQMEADEWVNIQVEAVDNISMDRVEFYLDGNKIDESTVAPYSTLWNLVMTDTIPISGTVITETQAITNPDGTIGQQVITLTEVISITHPEMPDQVIEYMQVYSGGLTVISNTASITQGIGYTETHTIKVIAYDAAGNETESEPSTFSVIHDPEVMEEEAKPEAVLRRRRYERPVETGRLSTRSEVAAARWPRSLAKV
ncbi:MAG: Ig-like domain-containing protein, partial [Ardenticatenia bacterium]|nr:Ig-like domain-containing protein [Ardenticatenia bacterium]